jgi:DNA-binding ferritin-like protein
MSIRNLQLVLEETFASNFVSYYRSHVAHVNIIGRNFYSDHKLLQKVYEYFQGNIDVLAEKLRTVRAKMPNDIQTVLNISNIMDIPTEGSSIELLTYVNETIETMVDQYKELNDAAEQVGYVDISNFAQDQVGILVKFRWMLEAVIGESKEDTEDDYAAEEE